MTWTKLGDDFNDRTDLMRVSRSARLLLVELYVFGNRLLLDGEIPRAQLRKVTDAEDPSLDVDELIEAGLVIAEGDLLVIDWADQDSAGEVKDRQAYRAVVQKRYRLRKAAHSRGEHQLCDPRYCKGSVTGNESSSNTGYETPSRPVPSRPEDRGQDEGARPGSAGASPAPRPAKTDVCVHGVVGGMFLGQAGDWMKCRTCHRHAHMQSGASVQSRDLTISSTRTIVDEAARLMPIGEDEADWFAEEDSANFKYAAALTRVLDDVTGSYEDGKRVADDELSAQLLRRIYLNISPELARRHQIYRDPGSSAEASSCLYCQASPADHIPGEAPALA